jgi:hypothetical protein
MSHPFRAAVEARDLQAMADVLAEDVTFRSPVVFTPYEGRDTVMGLLRHVVEVLEDFRYTGELAGDGLHGLVFEARVGDRQVQGWDLLEVDAQGRVTALTVMMRPLSGLIAVAEAMGARLAAGG